MRNPDYNGAIKEIRGILEKEYNGYYKDCIFTINKYFIMSSYQDRSRNLFEEIFKEKLFLSDCHTIHHFLYRHNLLNRFNIEDEVMVSFYYSLVAFAIEDLQKDLRENYRGVKTIYFISKMKEF